MLLVLLRRWVLFGATGVLAFSSIVAVALWPRVVKAATLLQVLHQVSRERVGQALLLELGLDVERQALLEHVLILDGQVGDRMVLDMPTQSVRQILDIVVLVDEDAHALPIGDLDLEDDEDLVVLWVVIRNVAIVETEVRDFFLEVAAAAEAALLVAKVVRASIITVELVTTGAGIEPTLSLIQHALVLTVPCIVIVVSIVGRITVAMVPLVSRRWLIYLKFRV